MNSYLSSLNTTPTAAAGQVVKQSFTKGLSKDDPVFRDFSKNIYN